MWIIVCLQTFRDEGVSNYIVVYLRLLTSAQLQKKADFFANFIEGERSVKEFCNQVRHMYSWISNKVNSWLLTTQVYGQLSIDSELQINHCLFRNAWKQFMLLQTLSIMETQLWSQECPVKMRKRAIYAGLPDLYF